MNKTMELLETLEEKIENIKWQIMMPFYFKKGGVSTTVNLIRKSAGILGKDFPKGTVFEGKIRKEWKTSFLKRIS